MNNNSENIKVFIRFRPLHKREEGKTQNYNLVVDSKKGRVEFPDKNACFSFDGVFSSGTTQDAVYNSVAKNAVEAVIQGYNSCVFAYGPTSSGKTFTMFGTPSDPGIIPRACSHIFQQKEEVEDVTVKCSFIEIYREKIRDLLVKSSSDLRVRQDPHKGVYVENLSEKYVHTPEEILETIKDGTKQRVVSSTAMNSVSSRSHALLTLNIRQKLRDGGEVLSKLHLVDLAGSENVGRSQVQGISLAEAQTINKSLSCLGNVIFALTEKGRDHVPYRDSKLTFLLQDSLGGNSKTILIATASPASDSYSETMSTLNFSKRVKNIKNAPKINKNESPEVLLQIIEELQKKLSDYEVRYNDPVMVDDSKIKALCLILENKITRLEGEKEEEKKREKQQLDILKKQRDLANVISLELQKERVKSYRLSHDIYNYQNLVKNLKESIENHQLLKILITKFKLEQVSVNPDDFSYVTDIEKEGV